MARGRGARVSRRIRDYISVGQTILAAAAFQAALSSYARVVAPAPKYVAISAGVGAGPKRVHTSVNAARMSARAT